MVLLGATPEGSKARLYVPVGGIQISGVYAKGYSADEWGHGVELLASGDEVDVDGGRACGLTDETECCLAGGSWLGLVSESYLLQIGGDVANQHGVLARSSECVF